MDDQDDLLADEGAGYLVSVSDVMAGLLFVFIITLMAFVIQFQQAKQKQEEVRQAQDAVLESLQNNDAVRAQLLRRIKNELASQNIKVQINTQTGVVVLDEDAVPFRRGDKQPTAEGEAHLEKIASVLDAVVPCYSLEQPKDGRCKSTEHGGKLESVLVEGHTDSKKYGGADYTNWNLSSDRAINSYRSLKRFQPQLAEQKNTSRQPLFSVAGYGDQRPLIRADGARAPAAQQRRITLRFVMTPPSADSKLPPAQDVRSLGIN